ncbi:MAG: class I SAM-dependent methyltransferase [Acidobacteriota bacterium]
MLSPSWLLAPLNAVTHPLRRRLSRSGEVVLVDEDKTNLFRHLPAGERLDAEALEHALRERHRLRPLHERSTRSLYLDVLDHLVQLETVTAGVGPPRSGPLRVLEVGTGSWRTVFGFRRFLEGWGTTTPRDVELHGLEVDASSPLPDLRTVGAHARARAEQAGPSTCFHVGDGRRPPLAVTRRAPFDVVALFFPFLTRRALLAWGLPASFHGPEALLSRSIELLARGGRLLVFNQTREERDLLHDGLEALGVEPQIVRPAVSRLLPWRERTEDRWATLARRR